MKSGTIGFAVAGCHAFAARGHRAPGDDLRGPRKHAGSHAHAFAAPESRGKPTSATGPRKHGTRRSRRDEAIREELRVLRERYGDA
jgi:hypothetical protein